LPHLLWMMTRQEIASLYDMITVEPAKALNLTGFGLAVGAPANLVVLDQPDEVEALRYHAPPVHVISHGKRLDAAKMQAIVAAGAGAA
jgi:cytosine/creatinine deaminase